MTNQKLFSRSYLGIVRVIFGWGISTTLIGSLLVVLAIASILKIQS